MRQKTMMVFDSVVYGSDPFYSSPAVNSLLGLYDDLLIQVEAFDVEGTTPTMNMYLESSNDQKNWIQPDPNTPLLSSKSLSITSLNIFYCNSSSTYPPLANVRIVGDIQVAGGVAKAYVRISVCMRDKS